MEIDKVLEVLNTALREKDTTIWLREEEIKRLKAELASAKKTITGMAIEMEVANEQSN